MRVQSNWLLNGDRNRECPGTINDAHEHGERDTERERESEGGSERSPGDKGVRCVLQLS